MVRTPCFHWLGPEFDPCSGNYDPGFWGLGSPAGGQI